MDYCSWFGTVMAGKEPVVESTLCRSILLEQYDGICACVIALTKSPSFKQYAQKNAIYILLPRLAAFKRKVFVEKYLSGAMQYLDKELQDNNKNKPEKYNIFLAIGLLLLIHSLGKPGKSPIGRWPPSSFGTVHLRQGASSVNLSTREFVNSSMRDYTFMFKFEFVNVTPVCD